MLPRLVEAMILPVVLLLVRVLMESGKSFLLDTSVSGKNIVPVQILSTCGCACVFVCARIRSMHMCVVRNL